MTTMTAQAVFNKVAAHLLTQRQRATLTADSDTCAYCSGEGLKCAAGCLVPDDFYDRVGFDACEGSGWGEVPEDWKRQLGLSQHNALISSLQHVHDTEANWDDHLISTKLKNVAWEYGLLSNVVDQYPPL